MRDIFLKLHSKSLFAEWERVSLTADKKSVAHPNIMNMGTQLASAVVETLSFVNQRKWKLFGQHLGSIENEHPENKDPKIEDLRKRRPPTKTNTPYENEDPYLSFCAWNTGLKTFTLGRVFWICNILKYVRQLNCKPCRLCNSGLYGRLRFRRSSFS